NLSDYADLLTNLVRWATHERIPLRVTGPGLVDCHFYRQPGHLILHLVNLTSAGTWRAPVDELIPIGPLRVDVQLSYGVAGQRGRLLVAEDAAATAVSDGWVSIEVPRVLDHEVVVIT